MAARRNIQYSRLASDDYDDNDGSGLGHDPRFESFDYSPKHFDVVPWKSIALALFLLLLGCVLLCLSILIFIGHMGGEQSQAYGLFGLGILSFLPDACLLEPLQLDNLSRSDISDDDPRSSGEHQSKKSKLLCMLDEM